MTSTEMQLYYSDTEQSHRLDAKWKVHLHYYFSLVQSGIHPVSIHLCHYIIEPGSFDLQTSCSFLQVLQSTW